MVPRWLEQCQPAKLLQQRLCRHPRKIVLRSLWNSVEFRSSVFFCQSDNVCNCKRYFLRIHTPRALKLICPPVEAMAAGRASKYASRLLSVGYNCSDGESCRLCLIPAVVCFASSSLACRVARRQSHDATPVNSDKNMQMQLKVISSLHGACC